MALLAELANDRLEPQPSSGTKLRQERHGVELCKYRDRHALNQTHAAPNGAWRVFRGSCSIDMALLTELSRTLFPLEAAKNRRVRQK